MPLPTTIADLSRTPASNYPAGTDSPSVLDDVQRTHASFIAQLRDYFPATPTGMIFDYAGTSAPTGYLLCDGSAISRTTYAALFAVVGTTWGAGDGSTTFNVPDLRRRTTIGSGGTVISGPANTVGATGGAETITIAATNLPAHTHAFTTGIESVPHTHIDSGHFHGFGGGVALAVGGSGLNLDGTPNTQVITQTQTSTANLGNPTANHTHSGTTDNGPGTGAALTNMPPAAVVTKIIKT